ncbi:FAD-dependent monooxygenase [Streptomyces sp. NPDC001719]
MRRPDILVAGAGPAGNASALLLARTGARVLLVNPRPGLHPRLAGEWIHPPGVHALARLGIDINGPDFLIQRGFIVHTASRPAVHLDSGRAAARTIPHATLTQHLAALADREPTLQRLADHRVLSARPDGQVTTTAGHHQCALVVGAEGRTSAIRSTAFGDHQPATRLSHTASLIVNTPLPTEEYGHVFLGGPGPILMYRVGPHAVRITFDVPGRARSLQAADLQSGYLPVLPQPLRSAVAHRLQTSKLQWAANSHRAHTRFRQGRCVLIGDAAGHSHPLAAQGLTHAFLDSWRLARTSDPRAYQRSSRIYRWTCEHIALAVLRVLCDTDYASTLLRDSLLERCHADLPFGARVMRLLDLTDAAPAPLARFLATVLPRAAIHTRSLRPQAELLRWACWFAAYHPAPPLVRPPALTQRHGRVRPPSSWLVR